MRASNLMLAPILVAIILVVGWVMNVIALVGMTSGVITGMFVLRAIGIVVAPLGSVLGLFF